MEPKKYFVGRGTRYNTEVAPLSRLFDTVEEAKAFFKCCAQEFETEYWIFETVEEVSDGKR